MENVPGMATGSHTALLSELISNFKELGYKIRLPYKILMPLTMECLKIDDGCS